jgi:hypothetical protein
MKARKIYLSAVLIALIAMLAPATLVLAGGDPPTPNWDKVTGPEIWGTAVVSCVPGNPNFIAFRVKRINDCNVQTDALVEIPDTMTNACPDRPGPFLHATLQANSLFTDEEGIPVTYTPIVTKIKNFTVHEFLNDGETATLSFDAQIKFLEP